MIFPESVAESYGTGRDGTMDSEAEIGATSNRVLGGPRAWKEMAAEPLRRLKDQTRGALGRREPSLQSPKREAHMGLGPWPLEGPRATSQAEDQGKPRPAIKIYHDLILLKELFLK